MLNSLVERNVTSKHQTIVSFFSFLLKQMTPNYSVTAWNQRPRAPSVFKPEVKLPNNLKSQRAEPSASSPNKILVCFQSYKCRSNIVSIMSGGNISFSFSDEYLQMLGF